VIVDSSALLAVILVEPEEAAFTAAMADADVVRMSAASWLETAIVVDRRSMPSLSARFDRFVQAVGIEIVPVDVETARGAREAYGAFGKGRHPAGLNFGDCFAYALAKRTGEALLFKGNDFARTDIEPALKD
jgi:ribonuclease VapC